VLCFASLVSPFFIKFQSTVATVAAVPTNVATFCIAFRYKSFNDYVQFEWMTIRMVYYIDKGALEKEVFGTKK
jgi:hypothetical protein